ncbi:MAG: hypothetical protein FJ266_06720 [Planctomycetes bacterium]|nr:hypothetical protein [Planctomycetota bacterium]
MDGQTLDSLADMICGDGQDCSVYRTGTELTRFFQRVGFSNFTHDGSTRKWWTLEVLRQLSDNNLKAVVLRLADPREYRGNQQQVSQAISKLNEILMVEGLKVELDGVRPKLNEVTPQFVEQKQEPELKPLPPPDFLSLTIEPGLGEILANRWNEAQKCLNAEAYLAATIIMGSLLEGMLLAVLQKFHQEANTCQATPHDPRTGKVKYFADWTLSDMINVAHGAGWLDLDVKKFSHALREFRNLIHPYQQMTVKAFPDKDTCEISWLVVQAAANDLARKLK